MKWMTKKQKVVNQEFVQKHITLNSRKLVERGPEALLNLSIVEKKIYITMENREMVDQSMNIEDKYSAGIMMLADDRMTGQR